MQATCPSDPAGTGYPRHRSETLPPCVRRRCTSWTAVAPAPWSEPCADLHRSESRVGQPGVDDLRILVAVLRIAASRADWLSAICRFPSDSTTLHPGWRCTCPYSLHRRRPGWPCSEAAVQKAVWRQQWPEPVWTPQGEMAAHGTDRGSRFRWTATHQARSGRTHP